MEELVTREDLLDQGRQFYAEQVWAAAYDALAAADHEQRVEIDDLERLAIAAHLAGRDVDSDAAWTRAFALSTAHGDPERAARCAFWLAFRLLNAGHVPRANGWVRRAQRVLDGGGHDGVERGYLRYLAGLRAIFNNDVGVAFDGFTEAFKIGERFRDPNLLTLARHRQGRALIFLDRITEGVAMLDEAMVAIIAGEVSPIVVGDTYCSAIEACQQILDVRRAQAWTEALARWCARQPDLVPFRGQCLVHRAEILQLRGAWREAVAEAARGRARLSDPPGQLAFGAAVYQEAGLHRLRGEFDKAEEAYRLASESGRDPQPGLALLRLAQGRVDAAAAAIRRALGEAQDRASRSQLLPAYVEIMLAAGDVDAARKSASALSDLAAHLDVPLARAVAAHATGAVLLADGDAQAALAFLRRAGGAWRELDATYEAARVRVRIGLACRALGDEETALLEFAAARGVFTELNAAPDLAQLESLLGTPDRHGLSRRELEVLRLVTRGSTNRGIATQLGISERTVDRHVSNILNKLGVSARAAATAYAYEHGLL
jgi:DNA-binding CsgD family transcriptional regulator/tetratricopeptide (TPR) repeat protein